jgi:hypothetical protein
MSPGKEGLSLPGRQCYRTRPNCGRSTIVNLALEMRKAKGKPAAVEFIRNSIKANEGIELAPSTCSDMLNRSKRK